MYHQQIKEFEALESMSPTRAIYSDADKQLLFSTALSPFSQLKNRYPDILPLERTRVHLSTINNQKGSDYINANFVLSNYISCQAPIMSTFGDFWRMVWENQSTFIIMLTKLFEGGKTKAHQYWPNTTIQFGDLFIQNLGGEQEECKFFILRRFRIQKGCESREIYHLHFIDWPDFGVPDSTKGIRRLVEHVNVVREEKEVASGYPDGPIVVHCSAGVGRAGSFIAIHYQLSFLMRGQEPPSIMETTLQMRNERSGMVQTKDQYVFIHQAVQDYRQILVEGSDEEMSTLSSSTDSASSDIDSISSESECSPQLSWRLRSSDGLNTMQSYGGFLVDSEEVEEHHLPDWALPQRKFPPRTVSPLQSELMNDWRRGSSDKVRTLAMSIA